MTSLMVNICIYSVYWTIVVNCHMVVLSDILNYSELLTYVVYKSRDWLT